MTVGVSSGFTTCPRRSESRAHASAIDGTPVAATTSICRITRKEDYASDIPEMDTNLSNMEFDEFMKRFMPGPDMPSDLAAKIPNMDRTVLLGALEKDICEELVRVLIQVSSSRR